MATLARGTSKRSFNKRKHLLLVAVKGAALLGVDEVVPVACGQHWFSGIACLLPYLIPSSLNSCVPNLLISLMILSIHIF